MRAVTAAVLLLGSVTGARGELLPCRQPPDTRRVQEALARLRAAVDPCGETAEVAAVLDALAACRGARYEIRVDAAADRNLFDRPNQPDRIRTIVWNPDLRTELEPRCDARPGAVHREPTASLLHELVHAAHDCAGLDPGQHELEAVRVENIYRRAAGLPQRAGYGDDALPTPLRRTCEPGACSCAMPSTSPDARVAANSESTASSATAADGAVSVR
jgi:hypothetical protein